MEKLIKLPWYILICAIMLFATATATFVLSFFSTLIIAEYICCILAVVICFIMYIMTERFQINTSDSFMSKYQSHCSELSEWLEENNITTDYKIHLLHKRIIEHINEKKAELKEQNDRVDKWTKTLAIPILLAVITAVMNKENSIRDSILFSLSLVIIFTISCCIVWGMRIIIQFPDKRKIEQMKFFADDLQDLLDLHNHNVEKNIVVKKQHKIKVTKCIK